MCDEVDRDPDGNSSSCNLDTDETDCYSSACEDDQGTGTSDDERSSDIASQPYVREPRTSEGEFSDVDILEYHGSPTPGSKLVRDQDLDGPEDAHDEYPDDGFKGFSDSEIKDNRLLRSFEQFREVKCLCLTEFKEEEEEEGVSENIMPCPRDQLDYKVIKDEEEEAQDSRGGDIYNTTPLRQAKKKAEAFLQTLKEVHGCGEGDDDGGGCDGVTGVDYSSAEQRNSAGKEVDDFVKASRRGLWSCDQCSFQTNYKRVYNQHHWTHELNKECYKCSICSLKFKEIVSLRSHVQKEHKDRDKTTKGQKQANLENSCSICGLKFESIRSLQSHVEKKHEKPKKYFYNCTLCDHATNNKTNHRVHVMKHNEPVMYKCVQCDYSSDSKSSYKLHMMRHTGEKPYACPHCPYRARQHPHLKQHLLFHMNLKPYECNICDFKTRQKSHLNNHLLWVHTDDKPYKCSLCQFAAKSRKTRETHYLSQHTNNKPYACKLCPFKSAHINVLNDHKKGHEEDLDYPCGECTWSGGSSMTLNHHVTGCHPDSKWIKSCGECDYRTIDFTSLRNHLKIKHGVSMHKNALVVQLPLKN